MQQKELILGGIYYIQYYSTLVHSYAVCIGYRYAMLRLTWIFCMPNKNIYKRLCVVSSTLYALHQYTPRIKIQKFQYIVIFLSDYNK